MVINPRRLCAAFSAGFVLTSAVWLLAVVLGLAGVAWAQPEDPKYASELYFWMRCQDIAASVPDSVLCSNTTSVLVACTPDSGDTATCSWGAGVCRATLRGNVTEGECAICGGATRETAEFGALNATVTSQCSPTQFQGPTMAGRVAGCQSYSAWRVAGGGGSPNDFARPTLFSPLPSERAAPPASEWSAFRDSRVHKLPSVLYYTRFGTALADIYRTSRRALDGLRVIRGLRPMFPACALSNGVSPRTFALSPFLLQATAVPRRGGIDEPSFVPQPPLLFNEWRRANATDFLVLRHYLDDPRVAADGGPRMLVARPHGQLHPQFVEVVFEGGAAERDRGSAEGGSTTRPATRSTRTVGAGFSEAIFFARRDPARSAALFPVNFTVATRNGFAESSVPNPMMEEELIQSATTEGYAAQRPFTTLHHLFNVFLAGANPMQSMVFASPTLNAATPQVSVLTPLKLAYTAALQARLAALPALVTPVRVSIVNEACVAWVMSDGSVLALPVYWDYTAGKSTRPANATLPPQTTFSAEARTAFSTVAQEALFNATAAFLLPHHRVVSFVDDAQQARQTAVVDVGTLNVRFFGRNTYGQFGTGSATVGSVFTGDAWIALELPGVVSGESIASLALGERHAVLRTTEGKVFFAGSAAGGADCNVGASASWVRLSFLSNVSEIAAGGNFSLFLLANASEVTACGGAGTVSSSANGAPVNVSRSWHGSALVLGYSSLCAGLRYACVAALGNGAALEMWCWGAAEVTFNTRGSGEERQTFAGKQLSGNSPFPNVPPILIANVDRFSCGSFHVSVTMRQNSNFFSVSGFPGENATLFPDFMSTFTLGNNVAGQLGAAIGSGNTHVSGSVYPIFAVPEVVVSARAPNVFAWTNNRKSFAGLDLKDPRYTQVFEVVGSTALENSTFVFTRLKSFPSPDSFQRVVTATTGQRPPDGKYSLFQVAADAVRDVPRPFSSPATMSLGENARRFFDYEVRFSLLPGLALFLVSNQTTATTWVTYADSPDGTRPPLTKASASDPDPPSGLVDETSGSFFRNWTALYRNLTTIELLTGKARHTRTSVIFPSVFFLLSNGTVIPRNTLSTACSPSPLTALFFCSGRTVVWGSANASTAVPAGGFVHVIDGSRVTWVAMLVSVFLATVNVYDLAEPLIPTAATLERELAKIRGGALFTPLMRETWHCQASLSPLDCSSAVWFEPFVGTDATSAGGAGYSSVLSAATTADVHLMTTTSLSGFFTNGGVAARTRGMRPFAPRSSLGPRNESASLELYGLQYETASLAEGGFEEVCVFIKLGRFYYFVRLMPPNSAGMGAIVVCRYGPKRIDTLGRATRTATLQAPPTPAAAPSPTPPSNSPRPPSSLPFSMWSMPSRNELRLYNLDTRSSLISDLGASGGWLDPRNVTFELSCCGGIARNPAFRASPSLPSGSALDSDRYDPTAYLFFTNNTQLQQMLFLLHRRGHRGDRELFQNSSLWDQKPLGCNGGFVLPVVPMVRRFVAFEVAFFSNVSLDSDEGLIEMQHALLAQPGSWTPTAATPEFSGQPNVSIRLIISATGISVTAKSWSAVHFDVEASTAAGQAAIDAGLIDPRRPDDEPLSSVVDVLPDVAVPARFVCVQRPIGPGMWHRLLVSYEAHTNVTSIFLNGDMICRGFLLRRGEHDANVSSVFLGARNKWRRLGTFLNFRDVTFCGGGDALDTGDALNNNVAVDTNGAPLFPCVVRGRLYNRPRSTLTPTVSPSTSQTVTSTHGTPTTSFTPTLSTSSTTSLSQSLSVSESSTWSQTQSNSVELQPTRSATFTPSRTRESSVTPSATILRLVDLEMAPIDEKALTVHNIRRSAVTIELVVTDEQFDYRRENDWDTKAAGFFKVNGSRSARSNPNGFVASFYEQGFVTGRVDDTNRTRLSLKFGPSLFYNSYADEDVTLCALGAAMLSNLVPRNCISFRIAGRSLIGGRTLLATESFASAVSLGSALLGADAAAPVNVAVTSIVVHFACFTNEDLEMPYLSNPSAWRIQDNVKAGALAFMGLALVATILPFVAALTVLVWMKRMPMIDAQALIAFPSLPTVLMLLVFPSFIVTGWQFASDSDGAVAMVVASIASVVLLFLPLIYLVNTLYDDANFGAKFVPTCHDTKEARKAKFPILSLFDRFGTWTSTELTLTFHRRFFFFLVPYSERRRYWFAVDALAAASAVAAASVPNNHPAICAGQVAMLLLSRVVYGLVVWWWQPHSTVVGRWSALSITTTQAVWLMLKLADIGRRETRTFEVVLYVIAVLVMVTNIAFSIVSIVAALRFHFFGFLTWLVVKNNPLPPRVSPRRNDEPLLPARLAVDENGVRLLCDVEGRRVPSFREREIEMMSRVPNGRSVPPATDVPRGGGGGAASAAAVAVAAPAAAAAPARGILDGRAELQQPADVMSNDGSSSALADGRQHLHCHIDFPTEGAAGSFAGSFAGRSFARGVANASMFSASMGDLLSNAALLQTFAQQQGEGNSSLAVRRDGQGNDPVRGGRSQTVPRPPIPKERDLYRLVALEEATGRPPETIRYDPTDDLAALL